MSTVTPNLKTHIIALPEPVLPPTAGLMQALQSRRSRRTFTPEPLSLATLATLLWAGFGVNRRDTGDRTAPTAHNWQEIDIFAVLPEGAFRYDAKGHRLLLVKTEDLRADTGTQDFVAKAPLNLVYVVDFARMHDANPDDQTFLAGVGAGCITQNVYLTCACLGLATVVRGLIDRRRLAEVLGLSRTEHVMLAQSVGTPVID